MGRDLGFWASGQDRKKDISHWLRARFSRILFLSFPFLSFPFLSFLLVLWACSPDREAVPGHPGEGRVVSLVPSLNELIIALGAGERLAARTDFDTHPNMLDLPSVGGGLNPSLERLVDLGVDVVLTPGGRDAGTLGARLEKLGMKVHVIPTNTVPDLYRAILRLGELFGVSSTADSLSRRMQREIDEIEGRVEGIDPLPVMYVVAADPPMTTGKGTFIDELIRIAGGRNVFSDSGLQWPSVGFEAIVNRDPGLLVWPRGGYGAVSAESLKTTPGWQDVPAVRDGRVLFVDGNLFSRPGPGFPEAARTLAKALHPRAFRPPQ